MEENDKELEKAVLEDVKTPFLTPTKAGALFVDTKSSIWYTIIKESIIMFKKLFSRLLDYVAYVILDYLV